MLALFIFLGLGFFLFIVWLILAICGMSRSNPTLLGIVVSLLIGMLPLYLILCFFGLMGERRA